MAQEPTLFEQIAAKHFAEAPDKEVLDVRGSLSTELDNPTLKTLFDLAQAELTKRNIW